jgi:hypothetical protein
MVTVAFALLLLLASWALCPISGSVRGEDDCRRRPTVVRSQQHRNWTAPDALTRATNAGVLPTE